MNIPIYFFKKSFTGKDSRAENVNVKRIQKTTTNWKKNVWMNLVRRAGAVVIANVDCVNVMRVFLVQNVYKKVKIVQILMEVSIVKTIDFNVLVP